MEQPIPRSVFLKRRLKKIGIFPVAGQVLFQAGVVPFLKQSSKRRLQEIEGENQLCADPIEESLVKRVKNLNDSETISLLRAFAPDVVVINGTRILSAEVLNSVPTVFLNMHAGITPLYRGVHGGYWALVKREPESCGVTVHVVDAGIDTGGIVYQALIYPTAKDNFATYPLLQIAAGLPLMERAIEDTLQNNLQFQPSPNGKSSLWSHPTIWEYAWNRVTRHVQ